MFCSNCSRNETVAAAKFCTACGHRLRMSDEALVRTGENLTQVLAANRDDGLEALAELVRQVQAGLAQIRDASALLETAHNTYLTRADAFENRVDKRVDDLVLAFGEFLQKANTRVKA